MDNIIEVGTQVRITKIDAYGWLGRENHPRSSHEGRMAFVTGAEKLDEDGISMPDVTSADDVHYVMYTVTTSTGESLELLDHEVEPYFGAGLRRRAGAETPCYATL